MCKIIKLIAITLTMMSLTFVSMATEINEEVQVPTVRIVEPIEVSEIKEEIVEEILVEVIEEPEQVGIVEEELLTQEEIELIALVTMAEAEGEPEEGKRLVIDAILNRVDHERFPDTVHGVIYQKNQFTSMTNGRVDKCYAKEDICELVREEVENRTNSEVVFFTADDYGEYGKPMFSIANHYFSSYV